MSEIKRYNLDTRGLVPCATCKMVVCANGDYVLHSDHLAATAKLEAALRECESAMRQVLDVLTLRVNECHNCPEFGDDFAVVTCDGVVVHRTGDVGAAQDWIADGQNDARQGIVNTLTAISDLLSK